MFSPIYLKIIDIILKIDFHKSQNPFLAQKMYSDICLYYQNYRILDQKPDHRLVIKDPEIVQIHSHGKTSFMAYVNYQNQETTITYYTNSFFQLETIVQDILLKNQRSGFGLHGSAVLYREQAILFLGRSGAGKSTIASLLSSKYPTLADDQFFIHKAENKYLLYRAPIVEKQQVANLSNKAFPIKYVFFIRKANYFKMVPIQKKEKIFTELVQQLRTLEKGMPTVKLFMSFLDTAQSFAYLYFQKNRKLVSFLETNLTE